MRARLVAAATTNRRIPAKTGWSAAAAADGDEDEDKPVTAASQTAEYVLLRLFVLWKCCYFPVVYMLLF